MKNLWILLNGKVHDKDSHYLILILSRLIHILNHVFVLSIQLLGHQLIHVNDIVLRLC